MCPSLNLTGWNDTKSFSLPLAPMLMSPLHFSFSVPATAFLKHGFRASPLSEELKCSAPKQLPSCHFLWLFLEGLRDRTVTSSPESILETRHLQSSAPPSIRAFPSVGQLVVLEVFWAASILILMFFFMKRHVYMEALVKFLMPFPLRIMLDFSWNTLNGLRAFLDLVECLLFILNSRMRLRCTKSPCTIKCHQQKGFKKA